MTPPPSYAVTVLGPDATRLDELATLFSRVGYAVTGHVLAAGTPVPAVTADAVVVDLRGLTRDERYDVRAVAHLPTLCVTREPVDEQQLVLRLALECRRGRLIRTSLRELGLSVCPDRRLVSASEGRTAVLTPVEFELLRGIVLGAGEVVPRERLVRMTWRGRRRVAHATLDSHIRGIRAKLRTAGIPLAIRTCRGLGYAWVLPA